MKSKMRWSLGLLPALLLAFYVLSGLAHPPQQATPPRSQSERRAYSEIATIKEPDRKIEALEKFIKDFPESSRVGTANQGIFEVLVKNHPDQKDRILDQAGTVIATAPDQVSKANAYNVLGSQLCDAGVLLENAERFAGTGLALVGKEIERLAAIPPAPAGPPAQTNAGDQTSRGRQLPSPQTELNSIKPGLHLTLGRIYSKQGKLDAAEKSFKDALAINPQLPAANLGLAEVYDKLGNAKGALAAYVNAAATSKIPAPSRQSLNSLYAKSHNGSLKGLEEMLDAKYLEANPAPFEVERYKPTPKRTNRTVLAEVFTGSGCPPCVAADLAADLAMERYSREELVVLMYHEHIPRPDPMTTPQTTARYRFYAGEGVPTLAIDGVTIVGGGARDATRRVYDRLTPQIEKDLESRAEAGIRVSARLDNGTVKATVAVDNATSGSPDLKLHIVLAEGKLRYTGENGVRFHPMVVRSIAGAEGTGIPISAREAKTATWNFDLKAISEAIKKHLDEYEAGGHRGNAFTFTEKKYEIDPRELFVVAFVQDEKTRAILQSSLLKVKP